MGGCATKPKVLGDKARPRSQRHHPLSRCYTTIESPSSLIDEKGSISFSHYKDQDIVVTPKDEVEDVDSYTGASDHYVHQDELPSYDDDDLDIHDPSIKDEAEQIKSAITKAIEKSENDVVEDPESSDATMPVGHQPHNDVVAQVDEEESSTPTQNDVRAVEEAVSVIASLPPTQSDHVTKGEDDVINTNTIPSTFAF